MRSRSRIYLSLKKSLSPAESAFIDCAPSVQPAGADFAMLFGELQSLERAQGLFDVATQRQVVDDLALDAVLVDDEGAAKGHAAAQEHVVVCRDGLVEVGDDGVLNALDAADLLGGFQAMPRARTTSRWKHR